MRTRALQGEAHAFYTLLRSTSLLAMVAGVLGGCAALDMRGDRTGDRTNPVVPSWFERPGNVMHVDFRRELGDRSKMSGEAYEQGRAEVDAEHNRVFVGSSDHGLYALRASDGSSIWRFATLGSVQSEPLYDPQFDLVYFGSHDGALYAVSAFDGHLLFRYNSGFEIRRKPVLVGEYLYFTNSADHLFAVDRRTGKLRWQAQRPSALGMEVAGHAGACVANGLVYMAYSDGHITAYDAVTGAERWTPVDLAADAEQANGELPKYLDVDTTPIVASTPTGPIVYVAGFASGVYGLDGRTGARVFLNEAAVGVTAISVMSEPAHPNRLDPAAPQIAARTLLIASSGQTGLWGLDATSGRAVWRVKLPDGGATEAVPISGALAVGTSKYGMFLLSPINGKVIDGFDVGSGVAHTPAVFGARMFVLTNSGVFLGVRVDAPDAIERARSADSAFFERF